MKISIVKKFLVAFIVILTMNSANAFAAMHYSPDHQWFTWDDGNPGLAMGNGDAGNGHVFVHLKKESGKWAVYCDEECTLQCQGIGFEQNKWNFSIAWKAFTGTENTCTTYDDIPSFVAGVKNAITLLYNSNNLYAWSGCRNDLIHLHICLHDPYDVLYTETYGILSGNGGGVWVIDWNFGLAGMEIKRCDDLRGALININPNGITDPTLFLNFQPRGLIIDNNTLYDTDVAVMVNHGSLFMDSYATITNSKSIPGDPDQYHGIGVRLANNGDHSHAPAIELGDEGGGNPSNFGTAKIRYCYLAVDVEAGEARLKKSMPSNPVSLEDNKVAVNLVRGTHLSKWAHDVSSFNSANILITVTNPEQWKDGDIVFTSGKSNYDANNNSVSPAVDTPLGANDINQLAFSSATDLAERFEIIYDTQRRVGEVNESFPVFRLVKGAIYNPRLMKWYTNLYNAANDPLLQDGDHIVYYSDVTDVRPVTITHANITIRAAKVDTHDEDPLNEAGYDGSVERIDPNGYTTTWQKAVTDNSTSFITVANGGSVTLGGPDSGLLAMNLNGKGRGLDVSGTATISQNITITGGSSTNGGGVYIESTGTVNLTGGRVTGNTASGEGAGIYQNGTLNVSDNPTVGANDEIYLPTGKVITKTGAINSTVNLPVVLENEVDGRDILVSTVSGTVASADLDRLTVTLADSYAYEVVYNATGNDNSSASPKNVIELLQKKASLIIDLTGMDEGDSATFTVKEQGSSTILYTVVLTANASGTATVKLKDLPMTNYTVTESGWGWAYTPDVTTQTKHIGNPANYSNDDIVHFPFNHTKKSNTTKHAESNVNNQFN